MRIRALGEFSLCVTIIVGFFDVTVAVLGAGQDRFAVLRDTDQTAPSVAPTVGLLRTPSIEFSGEVDSNSPVLRTVVDGQPTLIVFTSFGGVPHRSSGTSLTDLSPATPIAISGAPDGGIWVEAVVAADDGTWYGFYHNERAPARCRSITRTAPRIGAMRSTDAGVTWTNLGILIEASSVTFDCDTLNTYIVGGVGDFSATLDRESRYVYLYFSQYGAAPQGQGVVAARYLWTDRDAPVGKTQISTNGLWMPARPRARELLFSGSDERGVVWGMPQPTPIFPTLEPFHDGDTAVDAFWGPSIHWNTFLELYVMLVNKAKDESFGEEGSYISYNAELSDPMGWSSPLQIMKGGTWYPQVVGLEGDGGDASAGQVARLFSGGRSDYLLYFHR
jgi:hypothetical protein